MNVFSLESRQSHFPFSDTLHFVKKLSHAEGLSWVIWGDYLCFCTDTTITQVFKLSISTSSPSAVSLFTQHRLIHSPSPQHIPKTVYFISTMTTPSNLSFYKTNHVWYFFCPQPSDGFPLHCDWIPSLLAWSTGSYLPLFLPTLPDSAHLARCTPAFLLLYSFYTNCSLRLERSSSGSLHGWLLLMIEFSVQKATCVILPTTPSPGTSLYYSPICVCTRSDN